MSAVDPQRSSGAVQCPWAFEHLVGLARGVSVGGTARPTLFLAEPVDFLVELTCGNFRVEI
jgi:hypothetical protein